MITATPVPDGVWLALHRAIEPYLIGKFVVPGNPTPKGRPRLGRGGTVRTPQATKDAEKLVNDAFHRAMPHWQPEPDGTYGVMIQFNTEGGSTADLDNLTKLVWDALNTTDKPPRQGLWQDDIQVGYAFLRLVRGGDPDTHVMLFGAYNNGTPMTKVCDCGTRYRSQEKMCLPCRKRRRTVAALLRDADDEQAAAELARLKRAAFSYLTACMIGTDRSPTTAQIAEHLAVTENRARTVITALIEDGCVARTGRKLKILKPLGVAA